MSCSREPVWHHKDEDPISPTCWLYISLISESDPASCIPDASPGTDASDNILLVLTCLPCTSTALYNMENFGKCPHLISDPLKRGIQPRHLALLLCCYVVYYKIMMVYYQKFSLGSLLKQHLHFNN